MNTPFKETPVGGCVYALIKGDNLDYKVGKLVSVGMPRMEKQENAFNMPRTVVDVTYSFDGANYTDVAEVNSPMLSTSKLGALSLVATDNEIILKELRATLTSRENYIKEAETEVPKSKKCIARCKELIGELDTSFAEKQALENRISNLESSNAETNKLLKQLLKKLDEK